MAVTPKELFDYAEALLQESGELRHRNAAGRAFYGAFHSCRALVEMLDSSPELKIGTHARVIRVLGGYYGGPDDQTADRVRSLAGMYKQARDLRNRADYDIGEDFGLPEAQLLLGTAKRFAERVSELEKADFT